jgi:NAD(P)-dependent dehydrogenase (short-subunit alcohol dehydrogenase family)|tara:strand:- start:80 stop:877 length:798 start_codon:yes stop_codon:yes gene_type:complete
MDLQLEGKVALVTGGSRGIGKAIALALAGENCHVVIAARDQFRIDEAVKEIGEVGSGDILGFQCDTTDPQAVKDLVRNTTAQLETVDILVNNAAQPGGPRPPLLEIDWEEHLLPQVDTKVMGYIRCAQSVAPLMKAGGWGRIINISGMQARNSGSTVGSIRNVAVSALTKNLADELGPHGINVNCIHPGQTTTEATEERIQAQISNENISRENILQSMSQQNSVKQIIDASHIASLTTFLASPLSIAVTGETIAAGGGVGSGIYY